MALIRVYAHHKTPPTAFGVQSTVSSGTTPAPIATYWCELADQTTVTSQGFGPPPATAPPTEPVHEVGVPRGNFPKPVDQGFTGGIDFAVTRICVVSVGGDFPKNFDFTLIAPSGQIIPIASTGTAAPAPVGPGKAFCTHATVPLGKGVWVIEVRLKAGSLAHTNDFDWGAAAPTLPYVGLAGSPAEILLAVVFEGTPVTQPPGCHLITGTNAPVPCSQGGTAAVQATFQATVTPAAPPYIGAIDWQVTDNITGAGVFALPGGGTTAMLTFPGSGDYIVSAAIYRPGCSPTVKVWAKPITVLSCGCPTLSGTLHATPSAANPCVWTFYVTVNNPGAVPISYEWDFNVGGAPSLSATTNTPSASCTYTSSGTRTVGVRIKSGACTDQLQTTIAVSCSGGTSQPTTPTTPTGSGGIGLACALPLVPAMILIAIAGVALALWGCTAGFSPGLMTVALTTSASGLALLILWMVLCKDCPAITFLSQFFAGMSALLTVLAALLALVGMHGCGSSAAAIALLFLTVSGALRVGRQTLGCP